jgi:hypothetical protein
MPSRENDRRQEASNRLSTFNKTPNLDERSADIDLTELGLCNTQSVMTQTEDMSTDIQDTGDCKVGRRIVEVGLLANHLDKGCFMCSSPLQLSRIVHEKLYGLASLLYVRCTECHFVNSIPTGKRHHDKTKARTMPVFDINTKSAAGRLCILYYTCILFCLL